MPVTPEPDRFGIPDNVFGLVPEDFYGLLGRVVALGALVEMRFADVVGSLTGETERDLAGQPMGRLVARLDALAQDPGLPESLLTLRQRADLAMRQRNALVHSLWPAPRLDEAKGWRTIGKRQRPASGEHIEWTFTTAADMTDLITELVDLAQRLRDVPPAAP